MSRLFLRTVAWGIEHPRRAYQALLAISMAAWVVLNITADLAFWQGGLIALLFLTGFLIGAGTVFEHTTKAMVKGVAERTDLHPDLLRMDLADFMRNYDPKKKEGS